MVARSAPLIKTFMRFQEWLTEIVLRSAFLRWAAEHFKGDSRNLAGMFFHYTVAVELERTRFTFLVNSELSLL